MGHLVLGLGRGLAAENPTNIKESAVSRARPQFPRLARLVLRFTVCDKIAFAHTFVHAMVSAVWLHPPNKRGSRAAETAKS